MDLGLKDKVAVITGGSVGIGLAIARGLAAEGVHLALCARDRERLANEARAIGQEFGVRAQAIAADVARPRTAPAWSRRCRARMAAATS